MTEQEALAMVSRVLGGEIGHDCQLVGCEQMEGWRKFFENELKRKRPKVQRADMHMFLGREAFGLWALSPNGKLILEYAVWKGKSMTGCIERCDKEGLFLRVSANGRMWILDPGDGPTD